LKENLEYFPKQHRQSVFVMDTLTGQTGDACSTKLMVLFGTGELRNRSSVVKLGEWL
jgi:hypothetical protein